MSEDTLADRFERAFLSYEDRALIVAALRSPPPAGPSVREEEIARVLWNADGGPEHYWSEVWGPARERWMRLARAVLAALPQHGWQEERERCAKVAETELARMHWPDRNLSAERIAAAIRALPPPPAKEG